MGNWIASVENHLEEQTPHGKAVLPMGSTWPDGRPKTSSPGIFPVKARKMCQNGQSTAHGNLMEVTGDET